MTQPRIHDRHGREEPSPSERYARYMEERRHDATQAARFARTLPFDLDDFQSQADDALEAGRNVLVAAPTGAGKTVVADFAVFLARRRGVKAFYTTPIKALSNQKYHDLVDAYGSDAVGLLTGDTSVNSEADIVVMTTEVLRNMLYERSTTLDRLGYVILDEVHYLADRFRGPVWEEVIIHLPASVRIIALSATVSNVEDFSGWISSVRGATSLVVSEHRPVPLEQHVIIQRDEAHEPELIDLYRSDSAGRTTTQINPHLLRRLDDLDARAVRRSSPSVRRRRPKRGEEDRRESVRRHVPKRWAVVDELHYLDLLPGIYFIFSRAGCDRAVEQCLAAGLELTTDEESERIAGIVDRMVAGQLPDSDLKALHFARFRFALQEGFAPHHAGMIALFRQIVEHLFEMGLVRMVFATETLALGINMPARCVVIEKLEKFDGTAHVPLTPGEFTQLTGRAGRRGVDDLGHAIVVDHQGFVPAMAAALSSRRVYPLHSSFRPTFNMAVNLLSSSDYGTARATLDHSFAQWEANESSTDLESRMRVLEEALASYEKAFRCEHGDFREYMTIRMRLSDLQKRGRGDIARRSADSPQERRRALRRLDADVVVLRDEERRHPCRSCPDLDRHLVWGHRWMRETRELESLRRRYEERTGSVSRRFDSICSILESLGYLQREASAALALTGRGQVLRRLYGDHDLLVAEALVDGVLGNLGPRELATVLSGVVYEARRGGNDEPGRYPGGEDGGIARACARLRGLWSSLEETREEGGLEASDPLDFSLVPAVHAWAGGSDLADVLAQGDMTGGDFVRTMKRLSDLLGQISSACEARPDVVSVRRGTVDAARDAITRGVVAYSGVD
ncbi:DEAD/DEAH box helicase [uncultured Bifidobacterium sp.]|uniref:DEAD/DEAH box helicase n=1 Tax=uncultured Bifidobacterium sp. TaxID=165187 RepID=UPI0028DC94D7|nr:DEAD/DEAH box helicase [uncultured Bifidobacterium sp.]